MTSLPGTRFRLLWCGRPLGEITDAGWSDFPWVWGRFASAGDWPAGLRAALQRLATDYGLEDESPEPLGVDGLFNGWEIAADDGTVTEIGVPKVDFDGGTIEWR